MSTTPSLAATVILVCVLGSGSASANDLATAPDEASSPDNEASEPMDVAAGRLVPVAVGAAAGAGAGATVLGTLYLALVARIGGAGIIPVGVALAAVLPVAVVAVTVLTGLMIAGLITGFEMSWVGMGATTFLAAAAVLPGMVAGVYITNAALRFAPWRGGDCSCYGSDYPILAGGALLGGALSALAFGSATATGVTLFEE